MNTQTRRTTRTLANLAECAGPDRPDRYGWDTPLASNAEPSAGAVFLRNVEDSTLEAIEYGWDEDDAHEVADGCVPIYTYERWQVFVDLAAWTEDISEFGPPDDMEAGAGVALYLIARRLAEAIAEDEADTEDEDEETNT